MVPAGDKAILHEAFSPGKIPGASGAFFPDALIRRCPGFLFKTNKTSGRRTANHAIARNGDDCLIPSSLLLTMRVDDFVPFSWVSSHQEEF